MKKNRTLIKRAVLRSIIGSLFGMFLLHPVSMVISDPGMYGSLHFAAVKQLFAPEHLVMAGYFAILGGTAGLINALYSHKKIQLHDEIKRLSLTDELTSLYNRRYFVRQLGAEIDRAIRYSRDLSLLMIDLNNFKRFNDTYGHQKGDELLRKYAAYLKGVVRKPDFIARYGGDEFVIVMPEADRVKALKMAHRLLAEIEDGPAASGHGAGVKVSASIGTATFPAEARDIESLISRADSRLYTVKKGSGAGEITAMHLV